MQMKCIGYHTFRKIITSTCANHQKYSFVSGYKLNMQKYEVKVLGKPMQRINAHASGLRIELNIWEL